MSKFIKLTYRDATFVYINKDHILGIEVDASTGETGIVIPGVTFKVIETPEEIMAIIKHSDRQ